MYITYIYIYIYIIFRASGLRCGFDQVHGTTPPGQDEALMHFEADSQSLPWFTRKPRRKAKVKLTRSRSKAGSVALVWFEQKTLRERSFMHRV